MSDLKAVKTGPFWYTVKVPGMGFIGGSTPQEARKQASKAVRRQKKVAA